MKKRVIAVTILMLLMTTTAAYAEPLTDQLSRQNQQLQQDKEALSSVADQREEIEIKLEDLDNKIEDTMSQIRGFKDKTAKLQEQRKATEKNIVKVQEEIKKDQEVLDDRLAGIYESGQTNYLDIILDAESFGDLITRVQAIKTIVEYDNKIINKIRGKKDELEKSKQMLIVQQNEVAALQKESEAKLKDIKDAMTDQNKLIAELKNQERIFASRVQESQAVVNATMTRINDIKQQEEKNKIASRQAALSQNSNSENASNQNSANPNSDSQKAPQYVATRGTVSFSENDVLAYAANFLGTPYVWGGTTPNPGFDCSGFTRYVYAHFGVGLGRTTWQQINDGAVVQKGDLRPGDLVFFGKNGNPTHMGIYAGNNTYIHAPRTGDVVKISSITRPDYITARRVR